MGIGLGAVLQLAVGAAGIITSSIQAKKAREDRQEAQEIQTASQEYQNRLSRRRAAREERIKRAQILSSAEQSGASGSSGATGATGALRTNLNTGFAGQRSLETANRGISATLQSAADAESKGKQFLAFTDLAQTGVDLLDDEGVFG